jgi:hypothetical protein
MYTQACTLGYITTGTATASTIIVLILQTSPIVPSESNEMSGFSPSTLALFTNHDFPEDGIVFYSFSRSILTSF